MKDSIYLPIKFVYLPVYYMPFESYIGFYQKVKINVLENCRRYKGGNRDDWSHFSLIFKIKGKFSIVFVRLILGKKGFDWVTGPRREIDIRHEFDLKVNLKGLGCKQRFFLPFLIESPINN